MNSFVVSKLTSCALAALATFPLLFTACAPESEAVPTYSRADRVAASTSELNKSVSCRGRCGDYTFGACGCDAVCEEFGDCCNDEARVCKGASTTCQDVITCVAGKKYPTSCGASNGDASIGSCGTSQPTCQDVITCVAGKKYPTSCGASNGDTSIGSCGTSQPACQDVITCVAGKKYPTSCGASNGDTSIGSCATVPKDLSCEGRCGGWAKGNNDSTCSCKSNCGPEGFLCCEDHELFCN